MLIPLSQSAERLSWIAGRFALGQTSGAAAIQQAGAATVDLLASAALAYAAAPSASMAPDIAGRALELSLGVVGGVVRNAGSIALQAIPAGAGVAGAALQTAATGVQTAIDGAWGRYQSQAGITTNGFQIIYGGTRPAGTPAIPAPATVGGSPHLLVLQSGTSFFYFNLKTAPFNQFRRESSYNIAEQVRLLRRPALQAVAKGGETITLQGVIFCAEGAGIGQIAKLRVIAYEQKPVNLTTGFGDVLGSWYLTRVEEEQDGLMANGAPRKQAFTLEFQRYGDDYQGL